MPPPAVTPPSMIVTKPLVPSKIAGWFHCQFDGATAPSQVFWRFAHTPDPPAVVPSPAHTSSVVAVGLAITRTLS